jgi:Protein of unknown function (DUF1091)
MRFGILFLCILSLSNIGDGLDFKFLKIESCSSTDKSVALFENCSLEDNGLEMNYVLDIVAPMDKLIVRISKHLRTSSQSFNVQQFEMTLFVKAESGFRQFFKIPPVQWCSFVAGKRNSNAIVKSLLKAFKECCPELYMNCPLAGHFELKKIKVKKDLLMLYPVGIYRFLLTVTDSRNVTLTISLLMEIKN